MNAPKVRRGELRARARRAQPVVPSFKMQATLWIKMKERARSLGLSQTAYIKALVLADTGVKPDILNLPTEDIKAVLRGQ